MTRLSFAAALAASTLLAGQPKPFSSYDPQVDQVLAKMTLDEKIGQMTQADHAAIKDPADVTKYMLGSVLNGGSSDPKAGNSLQAWTDMYLAHQANAMKTRLRIPLIYGVDSVHGFNNVLGAVIFPHNIGLGCTRNPELVEKAARITALETRASGINWVFSPCVTVPQDERWGRTYEGFAESPDVVKVLGEAAVRGLQGDNLAAPTSAMSCAKHFIGDGGTSFGTGTKQKDGQRSPFDQGDTQVDEATLRRVHLQGYITAIRAGAGTIMPSYSSWNGVKCSGSKQLLTDLLKKELGFEGFLISDYAALDQLPGDRKTQVATSINAGMDMVMVPDKYVAFIAALKAAVADGSVPMSRIDDAVRRILRVKFAMGLMEVGWSPNPDPAVQAEFGSAGHRAVARECVRQSLVLLKNDRKALPLSKSAKRIHVAGRNADDAGNQCGGWTIDWQGKSGNVTTGVTTILQAIRNTAPNAKVTFSKDGSDAAGADVAVVVVGETPYAEMMGDRTDLALASEDRETIARARKANVPVVLVVVSGRPLIITDVLPQVDAVVAAWLPGSEGQGVADVLFGDYKPAGKLSITWPASMAQFPIHAPNSKGKPLFPFGYGLTY